MTRPRTDAITNAEKDETTGEDHVGESCCSTPGKRRTRRHVLGLGAVAGAASLAGCVEGVINEARNFIAGGTPAGPVSMADFRGSGPLVESRAELDAPSIGELPPLSGELTIYLGGGEGGLYTQLLDLFSRAYDDFDPRVRTDSAAGHANTLVGELEGQGSPADVFWSVDAGALARVAQAGYLLELEADIIESVPANFRPGNRWVGHAGRARAIPYNESQFDGSDIPDTVREFPSTGSFAGAIGWAPEYSAFQSFITAMRKLRGESQTRQWLEGILDLDVTRYPDEFLVSNAVADGEIGVGFANHYYALRVRNDRPDAPLSLAFTSGDAGALINTAGAGVVQGTDNEQLARRFVQHLLSAEAQEFFATRTFAYPMVAGVPPVGGLPPIEELSPPDLSLAELSDVQATIELLREVGAL